MSLVKLRLSEPQICDNCGRELPAKNVCWCNPVKKRLYYCFPICRQQKRDEVSTIHSQRIDSSVRQSKSSSTVENEGPK